MYELTVNYITAMASHPDFDLVHYLIALCVSPFPLTHSVHLTQVQTAPRCYLQLLSIWSSILDSLLQGVWSVCVTVL